MRGRCRLAHAGLYQHRRWRQGLAAAVDGLRANKAQRLLAFIK